MNVNIRIFAVVMGLAVLGLSGCTTVESEPVTTSTTTTETTAVTRAPAAHSRTETRVIHE